MKKFLAHPLTVFFIVSVAITLLIGPLRGSLMPPVAPGEHPLQHLWDWMAERQLHINIKNLFLFARDGNGWAWLIFVFAGAPTVAAIVVSALYRGRAGVIDLLARFRPWAPGGHSRAVRCYFVLVVAYLAGVGAYVAAGRALGAPEQVQLVSSILGDSLWVMAAVIVGGMFLDEGGTLEELGWRGFAMPLLQAKYTPLAAAVLLGLIWWAWHFPREIPALPDHYDSFTWWLGQAQFAAYVIFLSIVIAYFVNLTGGSVLPAIIVHGGSNFWSKALSMAVPLDLGVDPRLLVFIAASIVILWYAGPQLGRRPDQPAFGPPA
jgi:membrane protease YdiL (CAAX protease family)